MRNNVVHDGHFHRPRIVSLVGTGTHRVRGAWGDREMGGCGEREPEVRIRLGRCAQNWVARIIIWFVSCLLI